jgi:DNA primase
MFPIADGRGRIVAFGGRALEADAKPKYINTGETSLFSKGHMLYNFATARAAGLKAGAIVVAEGYMDVIALVRAGFEAAVAPLGTALTEDQLALLWRVAPEPILSFDGDDAGLNAAQRAARLSLGHLKPGQSLRFAFLPPGEDPDTYLRAHGAGAMKKVLDDALPLAQVLWRVETEGKDFSTPERRAGLERALAEIVSQIQDSKIADYYRRDFEQRVFDAFKRRAPRASQKGDKYLGRGRNFPARRPGFQNGPSQSGPVESVSPAVRNSLLARSGRSGVLRTKELELAAMLLQHPEIALHQGEILATLPFSDASLDRLRHELLNLAASGFRLESGRLEDHLVRSGMAELVLRLKGRRAGGGDIVPGRETNDAGSADADDIEACWLRAAAQLREIAELDPERKRAVERFNTEATEESWHDAHRLLAPRAHPND